MVRLAWTAPGHAVTVATIPEQTLKESLSDESHTCGREPGSRPAPSQGGLNRVRIPRHAIPARIHSINSLLQILELTGLAERHRQEELDDTSQADQRIVSCMADVLLLS